MIQRREIATSIILTLVTCGIYGLYWFVVLTDDANTVSGDFQFSGGMSLLLTLVTCGIFSYYWAYRLGVKITTAKSSRGMTVDNNLSLIYLLLCIFGLGIVAYALAQNELNQIADAGKF